MMGMEIGIIMGYTNKLKVVILTGNKVRHKYFVKVMKEKFDVIGSVFEPHHDYFNSQRDESSLVRKHFKNLDKYEGIYLNSDFDHSDLNHKEIEAKHINKIENINWVKLLNPDYILLYGTGILNNDWCDEFEDKIINLHLGLSPYYRGAATLFWPFYNDELDYLGITVHLATSKVDAGDILDIVKPDIDIKDNYYDITYKLIKKAIDKFSNIVYRYHSGERKRIVQDVSKQRYLYKKKDFSEKVLMNVLGKYGCENVIGS